MRKQRSYPVLVKNDDEKKKKNNNNYVFCLLYNLDAHVVTTRETVGKWTGKE